MMIDRVLSERPAVYPARKGKKSVPVALWNFPSRRKNFLIETGGFKIRIQRSIDAVVFRIVGGLCQIILLMKIFEIKLGNAILKCGERGASPVPEGVSQKHEIADNTVGNHNSIQ
jgi:hypothetical protein